MWGSCSVVIRFVPPMNERAIPGMGTHFSLNSSLGLTQSPTQWVPSLFLE